MISLVVLVNVITGFSRILIILDPLRNSPVQTIFKVHFSVMGLFQVVLDWFLMVLTLLGETFYLHKIVKEEHSVLMDMMKYLILNDVIFMPIILIHDIPSYFMEQPLSDKSKFHVFPASLLLVFMVKEVEILAQCLPFFYALLMLPIFALLNLIAIVAVYIFVAFKKRHISQIAITICYILSVGMSSLSLSIYPLPKSFLSSSDDRLLWI